MLFATLPLSAPAFSGHTALAADLHAHCPLKRPCVLHLLRMQTALRLRGYVSLAPKPRLSDRCFFDQKVWQARVGTERLHIFNFRHV